MRLTLKGLFPHRPNAFSVDLSRPRDPGLSLALQPWAAISERLRRYPISDRLGVMELANAFGVMELANVFGVIQ